MINIIDRQYEARIHPLLRLGFRPFFLFGALYAVIALGIWLWSFRYGQPTWLTAPALWWHAHEMFFGFAMAIVVGFLLTAVQNWTGIQGTKEKRLLLIITLWLIPRLLFWLPVPLWVVAVLETLFITFACWEVGYRVVNAKRWQNLLFLPMLFIAILANLASYASVLRIWDIPVLAIWQAVLWWFILLISIMAGRVVPFFTARKLNCDKPQPILWLELIANLSLLCLLVLCFFPNLNQLFYKSLLLIAGLSQLIRMIRWLGYRTFKEPLLWSLHLFYLCIPLGLLVSGLTHNPWIQHTMLHIFAIGGLGGMILAMIPRVSMGHTGRNIYQGPCFWPAFVSLIAAVFIRTVGVILFPTQLQSLVLLAGIFWMISFTLFAIVFGPMLIKPRADGQPG
ncbi:NnrS family protein [Zooshikella marina]|uniref:NnrS family protein n=1 Tax=Zooshikella ganghwensis TaxID=202772 RepID=UPI001BB04C59|nr:NnrS family protein [Zooshikella ganghwensis]MBU2706654.1 NnrS family protein [Zooshikella ganghwensis]